MKLKIKFEYQCQLDINKEEAKNFKANVIPEFFTDDLTEEINNIFLQDDGRYEIGSVTDFEYEVVD